MQFLEVCNSSNESSHDQAVGSVCQLLLVHREREEEERQDALVHDMQDQGTMSLTLPPWGKISWCAGVGGGQTRWTGGKSFLILSLPGAHASVGS